MISIIRAPKASSRTATSMPNAGTQAMLFVTTWPSSSSSHCVANHTTVASGATAASGKARRAERPAGGHEGKAEHAMERDEGDQHDVPPMVDGPGAVIRRPRLHGRCRPGLGGTLRTDVTDPAPADRS